MAVTIVIADDHPLILDGLLALFEPEPEFKVVARCPSAEETLVALRKHHPDILLLDINMGSRASGFDVLREMGKVKLTTRAVVLTAHVDQVEIAEAMRLGARGLLLKDLPSSLILQCVRDVHEGKLWLERRSVSGALEKMLQIEVGRDHAGKILTQREIEIVKSVAAGLRNAEIGKRHHISEGTVKMHLHNIYQKVGVDSRLRLSHWAKEKGLV